MIIFGTRSSVNVLAVLHFICGHCSNPAAQRVLERVLRFTLFFIPLFPISKKYFVACAYCGNTTQIDKEQADKYVDFAVMAQAEASADAAYDAENGTEVVPPAGPAIPPAPQQ